MSAAGPTQMIRENCPIATVNNDGLMSKEQVAALTAVSLQTAYNGGNVIDQGAGFGPPVVIRAPMDAGSNDWSIKGQNTQDADRDVGYIWFSTFELGVYGASATAAKAAVPVHVEGGFGVAGQPDGARSLIIGGAAAAGGTAGNAEIMGGTASVGGTPGKAIICGGSNLAGAPYGAVEIGTSHTESVLISPTGGKIGFYTAIPIAQQTGVAVDVAAIHAALVNLGLITA